MTDPQSLGEGRRGRSPHHSLLSPAAIRRALPTPTLSIIKNPPDVRSQKSAWNMGFPGHCDHDLLLTYSPEHLGSQDKRCHRPHTARQNTSECRGFCAVNIYPILLRLPPSSPFPREGTVSGFLLAWHHTSDGEFIYTKPCAQRKNAFKAYHIQRETKGSGSQRKPQPGQHRQDTSWKRRTPQVRPYG